MQIAFKMFFRIIIVRFLLILVFTCLTQSQHPCTEIDNCGSCSQNPECAWCSKSEFYDQSKKALPRCNSLEAHSNLGFLACPKKDLFTHTNDLYIIRNDDLSSGNNDDDAIPIRPQKLHLKLKVKESISFDIEYKEFQDYPLDLYYLMDGSTSMKDDKETLANLGDSIGQRLRPLTSKFRQGFGTFVDKMMIPYVSILPGVEENSCTKGDSCTQSFGFKHYLTLTNNTKKFSEKVNEIVFSSSLDTPEGGLDALVQAIACKKNIGWSEKARRLIILATDGPYHIAGDGKLGGIILPNDGECHMDGNEDYYTHSLMTDYPSVSLLNWKAQEQQTLIIFAVTEREKRDYELLTKVIEGSKVTTLASDSANIVDLVESEYQEISSTVTITDTFPSEFFSVKYYTKCLNTEEGEGRVCKNLTRGESIVKFRVEIELIKCPPNTQQWKQQYSIYAVGVPSGGIAVDVEALCNCPCEHPENAIRDSPLCNGQGSELCGLCKCDDSYYGQYCQCSERSDRRVNETADCKQDNSEILCSGRGNCDCGQCRCESSRYTGAYCECDNGGCPQSNGYMCSNHGTCTCDKCVCDEGWSGDSCACSTSTISCYEPPSNVTCNGNGNCECGECICDTKFKGKYCDVCTHESCKKCSELKHCVQCTLFSTGIYNGADCSLNCYMHSITQVDIISSTIDTSKGEINCKEEDHTDNCVFYFHYKLNKDKKYEITAQKTKECPKEAPIFFIIATTSALVVLILLICLCAYQAYTKIQTKREFAKFEYNKANETWASTHNPIYNNPVGTFQNPTYMGNAK